MSYNSNNQPYLKANRTSSFTISTTWTRVDFNATTATAPSTKNTFGVDPATTLPMVYWESTSKTFKFNTMYDQNMTITFYAKTTMSLLTIAANLQFRFVVPNGVSTGTDFYFPFPDDQVNDGYVDVWPVTINLGGVTKRDHLFSVYINQLIRTNGLGIDIRLSNTIAGTSVANSVGCLIQSTGGIF